MDVRAAGAGEKLQRTGALHRFEFTALVFRGAADGRGSSAPRPRSGCRQTEIAASAIRRGRRKRPRWFCQRMKFCQPRQGRNLCRTSRIKIRKLRRSDIVFVCQEYVAPNGAVLLGGCGSTNMSRLRRFGWKRGNYGADFSRCGRWSRFQRDKAASLVSSNRNCSVGDSTWPLLKTTLALPANLFIGGVNRRFSIIGCASFEARRQKSYPLAN